MDPPIKAESYPIITAQNAALLIDQNHFHHLWIVELTLLRRCTLGSYTRILA